MSAAVEPALSLGEVVSGGFCVGCGACRVASRGDIPVGRNRFLAYEAKPEGKPAEGAAAQACPFAGQGPDESEIAAAAYGQSGAAFDERTGYYRSIYAGQIADKSEILASSSGGLTSWFLLKLLELGKVDGVIHVGPIEAGEGEPLFGYRVSESAGEVLSQKKSHYYSTSFADVLLAVRGNGKRYAFVGVPCFIKAMRLLVRQDAVLAGQIGCFVGLVCGHMKSGAFAEVMASQVGVPRDEIDRVDFRLKNSDGSANAYYFGARGHGEEEWRRAISRELMGGNWGHALFQLKACDYCDDIFAETADICFGDAWLRRYQLDWRGTNIVLCRTQEAHDLLEAGRQSGEIELDSITVQEAAQSQDGNFRHRRAGLSLRLQDAQERGEKVPAKRIAAGTKALSPVRRELVRLRQEMAAQSHVLYRRAVEEDELPSFFAAMDRYAADMNALYRRESNRSPRMLARRILRIPFRFVREAMQRAPFRRREQPV